MMMTVTIKALVRVARTIRNALLASAEASMAEATAAAATSMMPTARCAVKIMTVAAANVILATNYRI